MSALTSNVCPNIGRFDGFYFHGITVRDDAVKGSGGKSDVRSGEKCPEAKKSNEKSVRTVSLSKLSRDFQSRVFSTSYSLLARQKKVPCVVLCSHGLRVLAVKPRKKCTHVKQVKKWKYSRLSLSPSRVTKGQIN